MGQCHQDRMFRPLVYSGGEQLKRRWVVTVDAGRLYHTIICFNYNLIHLQQTDI